MHRYTQCLSVDVVQGDVDGGDGPRQDAAPLEILTSVHLLPERSGATRIAADEEFTVMLHRSLHGQFPTRYASLPPAMYTLVGFHLDDQLVSIAHPGGVDLDI